METRYKEEVTQFEKHYKFIIHYGNGQRDVIEFEKAKTLTEVLNIIKDSTVVYAVD